MVFAKPTRDLSRRDILALVTRQEPENITLDYKRDIPQADSERGELAKDAFPPPTAY